MQILLFTIVAIALYLTSDRLLTWIEERRGAPLPNRSVIFFVIILVLTFTSFELIQWLGQPKPQ